MISKIFTNLSGAVLLISMIVITAAMAVPVYTTTVLKLLIRFKAWQKISAQLLNGMASSWVWCISKVLIFARSSSWKVEGLNGVSVDRWYFINSNHQSWADILILLKIFNYKIPFIKFFLKQELIWVPIIGIVWWALDYPFMKRYSKQKLKKKPHLISRDLKHTITACQKFRDFPVSILNFLEGTRFNEVKRIEQRSPYKNLLKPKIGGFAYTLSAMDGKITQLIDVTIVYPVKEISFWKFLCAQYPGIKVSVNVIDIPHEFIKNKDEKDRKTRRKFYQWVKDLWREKDELISTLKE